MTRLTYAAIVLGCLLLLAILILVVEAGWTYLCEWWRGKPSERIAEAYDVYPEDDEATADLTPFFRPEESPWDHDDDLEPGLRVVDVDRLERWWDMPAYEETGGTR